MSPVTAPTVVLVGTSGYALRHLENLLRWHREGVVCLIALVDLRFSKATTALVAEAGVSVHWAATLDEVFATGLPDLAVVATPPQTHHALAGQVLRAGVALYLEKPPVPLLQEFEELAALSSGTRFEIGFQETRHSVQTAAAVLAADLIGDVRRITAHGALSRPDSYYSRNGWSGSWFAGETPVLDGPLFNPLAHIVHSAFCMAREIDARWSPVCVDAEFYSVRDIGGDDLGVIRVHSASGPIVVAAGTTASDAVREPAITLHGDRGSATIRHRDARCTVTLGNTTVDFPPTAEPTIALLAAVTNPTGGADPLLDSAAVRPFVTVVNAAVQAAGAPHRIAQHQQSESLDGTTHRWLPGVALAIDSVTATGLLFSELGLEWAGASSSLVLAGYSGLTHPKMADHRETRPYDDRRDLSQ